MPAIRTATLLLLLMVLATRPTGALAAQTIARQDLALLEPERGTTDRARTELTLGKEALERATASGSWEEYRTAIRHFEEAALRAPDLAEPWFGLALARLALYERGSPPLTSPTLPVGSNNRAGWAAHIRATLARDPGHRGAITSVGHVLLPQGDRSQPEWVRDALSRAASRGLLDRDLLLVQGRLARQTESYDEAVVAFRAYAAAGGDPSIAALEEARALAGASDSDGAVAAYRRGLDVLTPAGQALYLADLQQITEGDELAPVRRVESAATAAAINGFWARRDAESVRAEGDRLREHLRRWAVAYARYRVVDPDRRLLFHEPWAPIAPCVTSDSFNLAQTGARESVDPTDPRREERILDDRGLMYLRHGDPLRVVWTMGAGDRDEVTDRELLRDDLSRSGLPSDIVGAELALRARNRVRSFDRQDLNFAEVWTYLIEGKVRSYLFTGSRQLGNGAPTTLTADLTSPELALLRAQIDPRFRVLWARFNTPFPPKVPIACLPTVQRLAREVRADLMVGGTTDDHPLLFPVSAIPAVQVAAVGDAATSTGKILVAYAIPADRLAPVRDAGRFLYPLRWRLTAVDAEGHIRRAEGELRPSSADSLGEGQFLSGLLELPVPSGEWQVGVAIFQHDESRGGAVQARRVRLDAGAITLSDLILGRPDDQVRWDGVAMNPLGTWKRGTEMTVFAELRGIATGTTARAAVEVRRLDQTSGRPAVQVSSPVTSTGPLTRIENLVDLGRLRPGVYRLTLTITLDGAPPLAREKVFEVVD